MHQQSALAPQVKVVPQREQRWSMTPLLHGRAATPEGDTRAAQLWFAVAIAMMSAKAWSPIQADKNLEGTLPMKNPLDSLGQTITLGVVLTIVVVLLIHAIA